VDKLLSWIIPAAVVAALGYYVFHHVTENATARVFGQPKDIKSVLSSLLPAFRAYRIGIGIIAVAIAGLNLVSGGVFILLGLWSNPAMPDVAAIPLFLIPLFLMWLLYKWGIRTIKTTAQPFHSRIDVLTRTGLVTLVMFFLGIVVLMSERQNVSPFEGFVIVLIFTAIGVAVGIVTSLANNFVHSVVNKNAT
jgi:hypothetical protein